MTVAIAILARTHMTNINSLYDVVVKTLFAAIASRPEGVGGVNGTFLDSMGHFLTAST